MRRHLECGLPDNRGQVRRATLISDGVDLNMRCTKSRAKGSARWHLRYANARVAEMQAGLFGVP